MSLHLSDSVDDHAYTGMDMEENATKNPFNLILEKVLTKDVVIEDDAIEKLLQ